MYVVHPNLGVTSTKRASHLVTLDSLKITFCNNIIALSFLLLRAFTILPLEVTNCIINAAILSSSEHLQYFHWKLQTASLTLSLSSTVAVLSVPFTQAHSANCVGHPAYVVDLTIFYVFYYKVLCQNLSHTKKQQLAAFLLLYNRADYNNKINISLHTHKYFSIHLWDFYSQPNELLSINFFQSSFKISNGLKSQRTLWWNFMMFINFALSLVL